jgi:hypothetical protein
MPISATLADPHVAERPLMARSRHAIEPHSCRLRANSGHQRRSRENGPAPTITSEPVQRAESTRLAGASVRKEAKPPVRPTHRFRIGPKLLCPPIKSALTAFAHRVLGPHFLPEIEPCPQRVWSDRHAGIGEVDNSIHR